MALDRQSIVRSDFPAAPGGYDPGAVDRHLEAIAVEVDELRRRAGAGGALATQTSEQVRAIVKAAEASAASIRDSAAAEARAHVARIAEAADALRERIGSLERELTAMLADVRGGAERLRRELDEVAAATTRLAGADGGDAPADVAPSALGATLGELAAAEQVTVEVDEEPALEAVDEARAGAPQRSAAEVNAQLVAANMAMAGVARDDIERYLAEHYELTDVAAVVERAYAAAER